MLRNLSVRVNIFLCALIGFGSLFGAIGTAQAVAVTAGYSPFTKIWSYSSGVYTDRTQSVEAPVYLGTRTADDAVYLGSQSPFGSILFTVGAWGTGADAGLNYQYSSSLGFVPLTLTSNPSTDFKVSDPSGTTTIGFSPPPGWTMQTVNGVSAYWVKISTRVAYTSAPRINSFMAKLFNLRVLMNDEDGSPIETSVTPTLDSSCSLAGYGGEWNIGAGQHAYGLRTDGGNCTLTISLPGHANFTTTVTGLGGTLKDLTSTPYVLHYLTKVSVQDEVGNTLSDASVTFGGLMPYTAHAGDYLFPQLEMINKKLVVARSGYVTEDGTGANTAFVSVSGGNTGGQTSIRMLAGGTACTGSVAAGSATGCGPLKRDAIVIVTKGSFAISGASVSLYTDEAMTTLADDVSKSGAGDAQGTADSRGGVRAALSTGTYYYRVTAAGYQPATGMFAVTSGVLNAKTVVLSPASASDTTVSPSASTVGVSPASAVADGVQHVTVAVTARNAAGATLPGKSVTLTVVPSGVVSVSPLQTTTDELGQATFTLTTTNAGNISVTPVADGVSLATQLISFTAPQTGLAADVSVSASQSLVSVSPYSAVADGVQTISVVLTIRNAAGSALSGVNAALGASPATGVVIDPPQATTNQNGVVAFIVRSTAAASVILSPTVGGVSLPAQGVTFTAPTPAPNASVDAGRSSMYASPQSVAADGAQTVTATVVVRNSDGIALTGKDVELITSQAGTFIVSPSRVTTGDSGVALFTIKSTSVANPIFRAVVGTTEVTQNVTLRFTTPTQQTATSTDSIVSATRSTVSASPLSLTADGRQTTMVTVLVKNSSGSPLVGKQVRVATSFPTGATVTSIQSVTDSSGFALFSIASSVAGNTAVTTYADGVMLATQPVLQFVSPVVAQPINTQTPTSDFSISSLLSSVDVTPTSVLGNGSAAATVTVMVRNPAGAVLPGVNVMLYSSSPSAAMLYPRQVTTDAGGRAVFNAKSSVASAISIVAYANGLALASKPVLTFTAVSCLFPIGQVVKLPDDSNPMTQEDTAVYYYGSDCRRHAFPNSKVYFTWYADFSRVSEVLPSVMSAMPLGENVVYHYGTRLVKFTTVNKVYAVARGGILRWVTNETVAKALYGTDWGHRIDDIADSFYGNYTFGTDIQTTNDYSVTDGR